METKEIVECLEMCAAKLGCQRYIIGNCEENVRIGNVLDEAAKRMEELENKNGRLGELLVRKTALDGGRAQRPSPTMEWISVEDRLPEENGTYLIAVKGGCTTHITGFDIEDNEFCHNVFRKSDITHWMPLPEPPKPKEPTFKDVFLEKFPKASVCEDGTPKACIVNIFPWATIHNCALSGCIKCWSRPYFEEEGGEE